MSQQGPMDVTIEGATGSLTVSNTLMSLGELDLQSPNFQFDDVDGANDGILRSRSPGTQSEVGLRYFYRILFVLLLGKLMQAVSCRASLLDAHNC